MNIELNLGKGKRRGRFYLTDKYAKIESGKIKLIVPKSRCKIRYSKRDHLIGFKGSGGTHTTYTISLKVHSLTHDDFQRYKNSK